MNTEVELLSTEKRTLIIDIQPKKLGCVLPERFSTELIMFIFLNTTRRVSDDI